MADNNATILIPDISGFTEFMTSTELSHSSFAINFLIEAILKAVGDEYEVSEIEGDAVLFIQKGSLPSKKKMLDTCLKIFNAFHFQRKWLQQYAVCPCAACIGINDLTLKFVVHHGPLAEIKIGHFVKQSGTDMIVAHRLLKNSIDNHEYLLLTEKFLQLAEDADDMVEMEWANSSEEYASIGKVDYRFTLLNKARNLVPDPPLPPTYRSDDTVYLDTNIAASFREVYMTVMNIPGRAEWVPGLLNVEQDMPVVFVGSVHRCSFENWQAIVSPLRMNLFEDKIIYAESYQVSEIDLSLVYEFIFQKAGNETCVLEVRFMNAGDAPIPEEINALLYSQLEKMAESLRVFCERSTLS